MEGVQRTEGPTIADDPPLGEARPIDALERLYRDRYADSVRLAHLLTGDRGRAEELVQDAFVRAMPTLAQADNPAGYLRTIVVNLCRDHARRAGRARALRADRPTSAPPPAIPIESTVVWRSLQDLPERQRAAVALRFYDDLPDDEIAALLGVRPATVRSLVHRALTTLKEVVPRD